MTPRLSCAGWIRRRELEDHRNASVRQVAGKDGPPEERGGMGVGGGGGTAPAASGCYDRCHFWLDAPVHVQICARVPFADELSVTSRHLFAARFTTSPVDAL